jgi:hypothetical protein
MGQIVNVVYGAGGWCQDCDPSHGHPANNILEIETIDDSGA